MHGAWRARSKLYNRLGPVVAMAQEPDAPGGPGTCGPVPGPTSGTACPTATIRALIAEADVPTRVGVRMILSSAGDIEVVGEAVSGDDAIAQAIRCKPDVVVIAIRLAGTDGITATGRITAALAEQTKVVVLTTFDSEENERLAKRAGASAFVSKHAAADELIAAVHAVTNETGPAVPVNAARRREPATVLTGAGLDFTPPLSSREREVMSLVAEGLSNIEIGERLYISPDTVRTHLKHIYMKSGVANRMRLVVAAGANGFSHRTP
jgi:DNA-binding NarL/FixJ family response regulator